MYIQDLQEFIILAESENYFEAAEKLFISTSVLSKHIKRLEGELGHTLCPEAAGILCSCGRQGHLESVASGSGIEACYQREGGEPLSGAEIAKRANEGEPLAKKIIEQAGFSLGAAIGSWANMFDPEKVIIAGSVTHAGPVWRDALSAGFYSQLPGAQEDLPIVDAELGHLAPIVGAAEFALDMLVTREAEYLW